MADMNVYERDKIIGRPYKYGIDFRIEYHDLDSIVDIKVTSQNDKGFGFIVDIPFGVIKGHDEENPLIDVFHLLGEYKDSDGDDVERLAVFFNNKDSHDYFIRLIRELYKRFC